MAGHPHRQHRAHFVEKDRVHHIAGIHGGEPKHYARGGHVHGDEAEDKALIKKMLAEHEHKEMKVKGTLKHEGGKPKHRADKVARRAKGGHVKGHKSGKTNVNVIVAPGGGKPPMPAMAGAGMPPPPMAGAAPPPMPPRPPMAPPPSGAPGMGPPVAGMGGMPPRSKGGRAYKAGGAVSSSERGEGKKSLADKKGATGIGERTPIQHSGNKSDAQNIGRGKPITYATGGAIEANGRAGKQMAPHLPAGSGGGEARIAKAKMQNKAGHEPWEPGIER